MKPDNIFNKLSKLTSVTKFYEPDLNDELTSICLFANSDVKRNYHIFLFGKKPALTYQQVIFDMLSTPQTDTQNVLEHGISVNKYFNDLTNDMKWIGNYPGFK
jgi:hypothetical protein